MVFGYARISTKHEQNFSLQDDALKLAGCERIFHDIASGAKEQRKGLDELMAQLRRGDTLIVWRLDRLGRSLKHLVELIEKFEQMGVQFLSVQEGMDTSTPMGKMVYHVFGAIAEFERNLIRERTNAGLSAARARGRKGGRPRGLSKHAEVKSHAAVSLYNERKLSVEQICEHLNIKSKATLYRYLRERGVQIGK
jgi:DNA invertase Pin-like site-specific DNA recombinase